MIIQYNCRGFRKDDEYTKILLHNADIVLLNETWTTKANQAHELQVNTHKVIAVSSDRNRDYGKEDSRGGRGHGGVAILARKEIELVPVGVTNDVRVVPVLVRGRMMEMLLIAVYLPTGTTQDKSIEYQEAIDRICSVIQQHGKGRVVVVGGDLNVDLTKEVHRNKKHVLNLMEEHSLVVPSNRFDGKATFYSNENTPVSLLDYFLIGNEYTHMVQEYIIPTRGALNRSDHEPVIIRSALGGAAHQKHIRTTKIDWLKAKKQGKLEEYRAIIASGMWESTDIESIVAEILHAARVLPRRGRLNKASQWWDPELTQLRKSCLSARRMWREAGDESKDEKERMYRAKKRKYLDTQRERRLEQQSSRDKKLEEECLRLSTTFYRHMRRGRNDRGINRISMQEQELFQPGEIAEAFLSHFVRVGQKLEHDSFQPVWEQVVTGVVETICSKYEQNVHQLDGIGLITCSEVSDALQALKRNKAAGVDRLTPEHLIEAKGVASQAIAGCLEEIVRTTKVPDSFKYGLITPVFKGHGADPAKTDNYRDITVQTILCKVFEKILDKRLGEELERADVPSELQFAYRKNRGTLQANFILQEVISANRDLGKTVYVAFLDVRKCFNSIWHDGLLYKLICANVSPRIILTLRNLYREFHVKVKVQGELSSHGRIEQGLKQGGVLSTTLLTLFMDDKIRKIHMENLGAKIGRKSIGIIAYADDEVLISTDPTELQQLLDIAYKHSCLWRYRYNVSKCKILIYGKRSESIEWLLGGDLVEVTEEYTHLGVIMTPGAAAKRRIEEGMKTARRALYAQCTQGLNIARMSPLTLHAIWRIYAEPALTYSLPVTKMTAEDIAYLERMQLRVYRLMQGLPGKTQKTAVLAMLGALPTKIMIIRVTMQFLGFLLRAVRTHETTQYVLLHGTENQDRESSLTRQWEAMLTELGLPSLTEVVQRFGAQREGGWTKIINLAIEQLVEKHYQEDANKMTSLRWLSHLLPLGEIEKPPDSFWPASRYSVVGRLATATRIKLLTGHSWIAGGIARRHARGSAICPLCSDREESLEHFLYECTELLQERSHIERRDGVTIPRKKSPELFILEANYQESLLIHRLYTARVQKEMSLGPNPTVN